MTSFAAVHLLWSGHLSPIHGTGLTPIETPTSYALAGATTEVGRRAAIEAAVVENVFSPYRGADITCVLNGRLSI